MKDKVEINEAIIEKEMKSEWHCDIYCRKIRYTKCEGQEHVNPDAPDLCPYFDEMLY